MGSVWIAGSYQSGQLFTGPGQLGAMPATVEPRLWGKPAARHEAAWST